MKHYVSKAMLEQQIGRIRQEIIVYEKKCYQNSIQNKTTTHLKKLRLKLHDLKLELSNRNRSTILKNGRK